MQWLQHALRRLPRKGRSLEGGGCPETGPPTEGLDCGLSDSAIGYQGGAVASGGGQVLQYSQHRRGDDLNQLPGWKRALLAVVAVAFAAAVAYGAFELTRTARSQAADLAE